MDELVGRDGDADMGGTGRDSAEEYEIARFYPIVGDRVTLLVLRRHGAWQLTALLRKNVGDKAAAVEPGRVCAAVAVRCAPKRERGADECRAADYVDGGQDFGRGGLRKRRRHCPGRSTPDNSEKWSEEEKERKCPAHTASLWAVRRGVATRRAHSGAEPAARSAP